MLFADLMEMVKAFYSELSTGCRLDYKLQNGTLGLRWFKLLPQVEEKKKIRGIAQLSKNDSEFHEY